MPVTEAIILAGGLGTRLRAAVPDLPKCMAPVKGRPFLSFVIDYYLAQGISHFIFSLGYKHEIITGWLKQAYPQLEISYSVEAEPLGTGGAVRLAIEYATTNNVLVLNGDTIFKTDISELDAVHSKKNADCTLTLKAMEKFDRYGVVETGSDGRIIQFKEKQWYDHGLINGGVYLLRAASFMQLSLPQIFSFEKDYLERYFHTLSFFGVAQDGYFIDIGIPADFERANAEL